MKQIGEKTYYTKQEAAAMIGCSVNTLNARIVKTKTDGYYMGHAKHYTAEQVRQLAEYRRGSTAATKQNTKQ